MVGLLPPGALWLPRGEYQGGAQARAGPRESRGGQGPGLGTGLVGLL